MAHRNMGPRVSIYAKHYVKGSFRARHTPRVSHTYRTKQMAWTGMRAFYRFRFYEIDRWYKARIDRPPDADWPKLKLIDPDNHTKSLAERITELNAKSDLEEPVDIGFAFSQKDPAEEEVQEYRKNRHLLEKDARNRTLEVDLDEIAQETDTPRMKLETAGHYGIFADLFHPDAYFHPVLPLEVSAEKEDGIISSVYYGNFLTPKDLGSAPSVVFPSTKEALWTLLMTNPDGNPFEEDKEILHWFVGNIPGNQISKGEVLCDYLQPLPFYGSGFHRITFLIFRQEGRLDLEKFKLKIPCDNLKQRSFSTPEFYKEFEDHVTPAGLAFCQCDYDPTVKETLHHRLDMKMPLYKFAWPAPGVTEQEEFPKESVPFNEYLDKYRDPKEIQEEILKKRLEMMSPFGDGPTKPKYPNLDWYEAKHGMSSWQLLERRKEMTGVGKYKSLYENPLK